MKYIEGVVQNIGTIIENSEQAIIQQIENHEIQDEVATTNAFLATIRNEINQHGLSNSLPEGLRINATVLTDKGRGTQESRLGADFSIILNINLDNFVLRKGVLFQAKKIGNGITTSGKGFGYRNVSFTNTRLDELRLQVNRMFQITADNFVIIYDARGFQVVPGNSIQGLTEEGTVYAKPISSFFKEFLMCFIGDPRLRSTNTDEWERLPPSQDLKGEQEDLKGDQKYLVRTGLEISLKGK